MSCDKCNKVLTYSGHKSGTSGLRRHVCTVLKGQTSLTFMSNQSKVSSALNATTTKCVDFVCADIRPYDTVSGQGFIKLTPCRHTSQDWKIQCDGYTASSNDSVTQSKWSGTNTKKSDCGWNDQHHCEIWMRHFNWHLDRKLSKDFFSIIHNTLHRCKLRLGVKGALCSPVRCKHFKDWGKHLCVLF